MHEFHIFGGGMMFFWWFLFIALVVIVAWALINSNKPKGKTASESPMDILKRRYAKGDIDKEEFEEKKEEILKQN